MAASVINQTLQAEAYSEPSQTSKMELFAKTVNGFKPLNTCTKRSINSISGGVLNIPMLWVAMFYCTLKVFVACLNHLFFFFFNSLSNNIIFVIYIWNFKCLRQSMLWTL